MAASRLFTSAALGLVLGAQMAASVALADTHDHTVRHARPAAHAHAHDKAGATGAAAGKPDKAAPPPEEKKSYYVPTRGYRLEPQPDIPPYVRNLGKTYKEFEGIDWLNVGLDSRVRFEYRHNDYRPWNNTFTGTPVTQRRYSPNSLWLVRTRAYLGVQNILDPFRFVIEFQDSRAYNSLYELQGQEVNETDFISGYGELFFKDALGKDDRGNNRPLLFRAGRQHFEVLDRRLIAENEFRNTTNNFDGFRMKAGSKDNDWDLDSFMLRPVIRYPYGFDRPEWQNWIYGTILSIRRWSEYATIQPYFMGRKQYADPLNQSNALKVHRDTYAPGLRVYGVLGDFDYDLSVNKQFGEIGQFQTVNGRQVQVTNLHDAIAYGFEFGYTFSSHPWKPRFSADYIYGSGDKNPFDRANQTFDIFYGFNQPFTRNDYFAWNNLRAVKGRVEFTPLDKLQIDSTFSAYWLASASSAWDRANLVAPLGNRGDFIGTEIDFRARYKLSQFINLTASYARFWPGGFTSSFAQPVALQPYFPQSFPGQTTTTNGLTARPTDFFYLEVTANGFGDGKPIEGNPARDFLALASPEADKVMLPPRWRGVYVGLNGGAAWSNPRTSVLTAPIGNLPASPAVAASSILLDPNTNLSGFVGGMQLGVNYRFDNNIVAGAEADLRGVSGNREVKRQVSSVTAAGNSFLNFGQQYTQLSYLGTIRGRLGYLATPTVQLYGTGGLAYGGVISNTSLYTARIGGSAITEASPRYQDSLIGWAAGGGVEWAITPKWSLKAEYLHYDLGSATAFAPSLPPGSAHNYAAWSSTRFDGNLVQAGVNRHFDLFNE